MTPDELKYFLKYIARQFWLEIKAVIKSFTNLARPRLWMIIFSLVLIYQLAFIRRRFEVIFTLLMILFIWTWSYWEAGHWKGEMRREKYKKLKEKQKEERK